eukprot:TRINITY_DN7598_c1_g1_i2.p1 TRINITY_DN7598_c1_g1~~TRINITY_DN7598_c1_g1_i2.p1  ORF type:complete len:838 (+),score=181.42 TRINITY_DN7598_c1_g1_i2:95-2608(+)
MALKSIKRLSLDLHFRSHDSDHSRNRHGDPAEAHHDKRGVLSGSGSLSSAPTSPIPISSPRSASSTPTVSPPSSPNRPSSPISPLLSTLGVTCSLCDKDDETPAVVRCKECGGTAFCDLHMQVHNRSKSTKKHKVTVLPLAASSSSSSASPRTPLLQSEQTKYTKQSQTPKCISHSNEDLALYCESCDRLICKECSTSSHQSHTFGLVAHIAATQRSELAMWLSRASGVVSTMRTDTDYIQSVIGKVEKDVRDAREEVKHHIAKLKTMLETREKALQEEIQSVDVRLAGPLRSKLEQLEELMQDTAFLIEQADQAIVTSKDDNLISAGKHLATLFTAQLKDVTVLSWDDARPLCDALTSRTPSTSSSSIATIKEDAEDSVVFLEDKQDSVLEEGLRSLTTLRTLAIDIEALEAASSPLIGSASSTSSSSSSLFDGKVLPRPITKLIPMSINGVPKKLSFTSATAVPREYPKVLKPSRKFGSRGALPGQFNTPHYIAVSSNVLLEHCNSRVDEDSGWSSMVVVGDDSNHRLQVLDKSTGKVISVIGEKGSARGQLSSPLGVALMCTHRTVPRMIVLVADMGNHRVQAFDAKTGEYVYLIADSEHMKGPHGLAVIPQTGHVVVANGYSHCVSVYQGEAAFMGKPRRRARGGSGRPPAPIGETSSPSGSSLSLCSVSSAGSDSSEPENNANSSPHSPARLITVIGTPHQSGSADGQFDGPCGIAVNSKGHIIVADWHNSRIQVFDSIERNCVFIRKFGGKGLDNGQFRNPWGVCVDQFDRILVSDWSNHRVQVFTEEGIWIHTWKIEEARKPRSPAGICVDPDTGYVYVVDCTSHQVLVY